METVLLAVWPFLNLALFAIAVRYFFLFINRFSEKFGCASTAVVVLLGAAMCSSPKTQPMINGKSAGQFQQRFAQPAFPIQAYRSRAILLLDGHTFSIKAQTHLSPTQRGDSVSVAFTPFLSGWVSGIDWQPTYSWANPDSNCQISYRSDGTLVWRLLNVPVFHQYKTFAGRTTL